LDKRVFAAKGAEVGAAEPNVSDAQQDIAGPHLRLGNIADRPGAGRVEEQCFHSDLASVLASIIIGFGVS
jgi:hypothetical protein